MKRIIHFILLISFVIGMTACNDETSSSRSNAIPFLAKDDTATALSHIISNIFLYTLLFIGKPAKDNAIYLYAYR